MRCRFIRKMRIDERTAPPELMAVAVPELQAGKTRWFLPVGAEYESPLASLWVRHGCAESVDVECEAATDRTEAELRQAQMAFDRMRAGIHPDDFNIYAKGYISGYEMDGSYKPGPNWDEWQRIKASAERDSEW